jgi:hypothetical protein
MLEFDFSPHDDMLEARVDEGFYHISGYLPEFYTMAFLNGECIELGNFSTIYEALDETNKHYKEYKNET